MLPKSDVEFEVKTDPEPTAISLFITALAPANIDAISIASMK